MTPRERYAREQRNRSQEIADSYLALAKKSHTLAIKLGAMRGYHRNIADVRLFSKMVREEALRGKV